MRNLKVAVAQFEPKDGDKAYNLSVIEELTAKAKARGAEVISFHEIIVATLTEDKLTLAGGYRYRNARKPELYGDILGAAHQSETKPAWLKDRAPGTEKS